MAGNNGMPTFTGAGSDLPVKKKVAEPVANPTPFDNEPGKERQQKDYKFYQGEHEKQIYLDQPDREALTAAGITNPSDQDDYIRNTLSKVGEYAMKNNIEQYDDDTFKAAAEKMGLAIPDNDTFRASAIDRANQQRKASLALWQLKKKNGKPYTDINGNPVKQDSKTGNAVVPTTPPPAPQAEHTATTQPIPTAPTKQSKELINLGSINTDLKKFPSREPQAKDHIDHLTQVEMPEQEAVPIVYNTKTGPQQGKVYINKYSSPQERKKLIDEETYRMNTVGKYSPATPIPIGNKPVDPTKPQGESYLHIGDMTTAYKNLQTEAARDLYNVILERGAVTGNPEYMRAAAGAIKDRLLPLLKDSENTGVIDYLNRGVSQGRWRVSLFDGLGISGEYEAIVGNDPIIKEVFDNYKRRFSDMEKVAGFKKIHGSKVDMKLFDQSAGNEANHAINQFLAGGLESTIGLAGAGVSDQINALMQLQNRVSRGMNPNSGSYLDDLWNVFTQDPAEVFDPNKTTISAATIEEMRRLVPQYATSDPNISAEEYKKVYGETTMLTGLARAGGELTGSIMGGGLKIGGAAVVGATKLAKSIPIMKVLAQQPMIQRTAQFINKVAPELNGMQTASTFMMAHIIENFPQATTEDAMLSFVKGKLFHGIGTAITNRFIYPIVAQNQALQSVLTNPTLRKFYNENYGEGALNRVTQIAQVQKDFAYTLGNTIGNPAQGLITSTIMGEEYDSTTMLLDILYGGWMGRRLRDMRQSKDIAADQHSLEALAALEDSHERYDDAKRYAEERGKVTVQDPFPDSEVVREDATEQNPTPEPIVNPKTVSDIDEAEIKADIYAELNRKYRRDVAAAESSEPVAGRTTISETTAEARIGEIPEFYDNLNTVQKMFFEKMRPEIGGMKIVYHDGPTDYDTETRTAYVDNKIKGTPEEINAIIHEGAHDFSYNAIESNPALATELMDLRYKVQNTRGWQKWAIQNPAKAAYMLSGDKPHEFFAGLVDNVHGISDVLAKETTFGSQIWGLVSKAFDKDGVSGQEVLAAVKDLKDNFPIPVRGPVETGTPVDTQDQVMQDDYTAMAMDWQEAEMQDQPDPGRLGQFSDFVKSVGMGNLKSYKQAEDKQEAEKLGYTFLAMAHREGIDDTIALGMLKETIIDQTPDWDSIDPLERSRRLVQGAAKIFLDNRNDEDIKRWREASEKMPVEGMKIEQLVTSPAIKKEELAALVGAEHVGAMEKWLNVNSAHPSEMVDGFASKAASGAVEMGATQEQSDLIHAKAKNFAIDYLRTHNYVEEVVPLGIGKNAKGEIYIAPIPGAQRSPLTQKKLQKTIQAPVPFRHRLSKLAKEMLTSPNKAEWPSLNGKKHADVVSKLTNVKLGRVTDSKELGEAGLFIDSKSVGKQLLNSGFFYLPHGADGNLFVDLRDFIRENPTKQGLNEKVGLIEDLNIMHHLGSERIWGPQNNKQAASALGAFKLRELVRMARDKETIQPNEEGLKGLLRDEVYAKESHRKAAYKRAEELAMYGNEAIKKLAKYYGTEETGGVAPVRFIDDPEALKVASEEDVAANLADVISHYYHKVQDRANINDFITNDKGEFVKNQSKYVGVTTQAGYNHFRDTEVADAILRAVDSSHAPMHFNDRAAPEEVESAKLYWKDHGVHIDGNGNAKIKHFVMTDAWAEANPEVWLAMSGQMEGTPIPPSKLYDGGTFLINPRTHKVLSQLTNNPVNETGAIKFGYGGDWIYKSMMHQRYNTGNPVVDGFFDELRRQGVSGLAVSSTIKSKAREYNRTTLEPGEAVVHDDDGTVLGIEKDGKFKGLNAEEITARYAGMQIAPELIKSYNLVGPDAIGFANTAKVNNDFSGGITLSVDRSPYTLDGSPVGDVMRRAIRSVKARGAATFNQVRKGAYDITVSRGAIKSKEGVKFVRSMIKHLDNMDASQSQWRDQEAYDMVMRGLRNAIGNKDSVNASALHVLEHTYGHILLGEQSLHEKVLANAYERAHKTKVFGKMYKLAPYMPTAYHVPDAFSATRDWKKVQFHEEAINQGLEGDQVAAYIQEKMQENEVWVNEFLAKAMPNGILVKNDNGIIISRNDLDAINEEVRKRRARGEDVPYVTVGSKVMNKLNPADALDSYAPRVIVGVDTQMNTGIMINQDFAINKIGRDHDGDDMAIFWQDEQWDDVPDNVKANNDWLRATGGNQFVRMWNALYKAGAHLGDPYKEAARDPTTLTNLKGEKFPTIDPDQRAHGQNAIYQTLKANSALGTDVGDGISMLNTYYEALSDSQGMIEANGGQWRIDQMFASGGGLVFDNNVDFELLKKNDAYVKQAQYDTYQGILVSPEDVFFGSRVADIQLMPGTSDDYVNAVMKWKSTGRVDPLLISAYKSALQKQSAQRVTGDFLLSKPTATRPYNFADGTSRSYIDKLDTGSNREVNSARLDMEQKLLANVHPSVQEYSKENHDRAMNEIDSFLAPYAGANAYEARFSPFFGNKSDLSINPNAWMEKMTPVDNAQLREMFTRTKAKQPFIVQIAPGYEWTGSREADKEIILSTPQGDIPMADIFGPKGTVHTAVMDIVKKTGLSFAEIFPPSIVGGVQMGTYDKTKTVKDYEEILRNDPGTAIIRGSTSNDLSQDHSRDLNHTINGRKEYPNFDLVGQTKNTGKKKDGKYVFEPKSHAEIVKELGEVVAKHMAEGRRVVIETNTFGEVPLPSSLLDIGKKTTVNRVYTDRDLNRLTGTMMGIKDPKNGYIAALAKSLSSKQPGAMARVHKGLKDAGANTYLPTGQDVLDAYVNDYIQAQVAADIFPEQREHNTPIPERAGRKLGMFNGKGVPHISGTTFGEAKAGRVNRLNKYLGKDITTLKDEELVDIMTTAQDWLNLNFGDAAKSPEFLDLAISMFDPMQIRAMQDGIWADTRKLDRGEHYERVQKYIYLWQGISHLEKLAKREGRPSYVKETANFLAQYGPLAMQSAPEMVRRFADDLTMANFETPIYESAHVDIDNSGQKSSKMEVATLGMTHDQTTGARKWASPESLAYLTHGYRKHNLNGIVDLGKADGDKYRKKFAEYFPGEHFRSDEEKAEKTIKLVEAAKRILHGSDEMQAAAPVEFTAKYNGNHSTATAMITRQDGTKVPFTTDVDGYFTREQLSEMSKEIVANDIQHVPGMDNSSVRSIIEQAIMAKAANTRNATYMYAMADGIDAYVQNTINSIYPADQVHYGDNGFQEWQQLAKTFTGELRNEADARARSGLLDNLDATRYVNYDRFAESMQDIFDNIKDLHKQALDVAEREGDFVDTDYYAEVSRLGGLADALGLTDQLPLGADAFQAGQAVLSHLQKRKRHADRFNSQLTSTNGYFIQELDGDPPEPVMYNLDDYLINKFVLGAPDRFEPDLVHRRNQDAFNNMTNKLHQVFDKGFTTEQGVRSVLGMKTLTNTVATNNMRSLFSADGTIYSTNVNIHGTSGGLRATIHDVHSRDGRRFLTQQEMGLAYTTPVVITYAVGKGDGDARTIQGRLAGVGRVDKNVRYSKEIEMQRELVDQQIKVLQERAKNGDMAAKHELETAMDQRMRLDVQPSQVPEYVDMIAVYNQDTGVRSYIDLSAVSSVQAGQYNGMLAKGIQRQREKYFLKTFGSEDAIGANVFNDLSVSQFKMLDEDMTIKSYTGLKAAPNHELGFFAQLGREDVPTASAKAMRAIAVSLNKVPSNWSHGYGKQTAVALAGTLIGVTGLATGNMLLAGAGGVMAAKAIGGGAAKYVRNAYGNSKGVGLRMATTLSGATLADAWPFSRKKKFAEGTPAAATASRRISTGAGLQVDSMMAAEQADMSRQNTLKLAHMLNSMEHVKHIVDGWGRILKDEDLVEINNVIKSQTLYSEKMIADIRNGQLSLSMQDGEQYIKNLSELKEMNIDGMNQILMAGAKVGRWLPPLAKKGLDLGLSGIGGGLGWANNRRLQVWKRQGGTEADGIEEASMMGMEAFDRMNAGKPIVNDQEAITNFINSTIETVQGKFDEKAYHLQTPLMKATTLFSQYFQNYNRRGTIGFAQERAFWKEFAGHFAKDTEFRSALKHKYGIDIGYETMNNALTPYDPETNKVHTFLNRTMALKSIQPLLVAALISAIQQNIDEGSYKLRNWLKTMGDGIYGQGDPVGAAVAGAIKLAGDEAQYLITDGKRKDRDREMGEDITDMTEGMLNFGGFGYAPLRYGFSLLVLKAAHESGALPDLKMPSDERMVNQFTRTPYAGPVGAAGDIVKEVNKAVDSAQPTTKKRKKRGSL